MQMCGMRLQSLNSARCEQARRLMEWMENGVLEALTASCAPRYTARLRLCKGPIVLGELILMTRYDAYRYLEKCVLIISSDEQAEHVIEAWALTIDWRMPALYIESSFTSSGSTRGDEGAVVGD